MFYAEPLRLLPRSERIQLVPAAQSSGQTQFWQNMLSGLRMRQAVSYLPGRVNRLLQIGYGDGRLMPELDSRANQLFGIDEHAFHEEVQDRLRLNGVHAKLRRGTPDALPYDDRYFDRVICCQPLSATTDLESAALEMSRVLTATGRLVYVVFNGEAGLQHEKLLLRSYDVVREYSFPWQWPARFSFFRVLELEPNSPAAPAQPRSEGRQRIAV